MTKPTNPWRGRGRWLAAMLTAALALGLLLNRLAMPPAAAEPMGPGQSADGLMQEFENVCNSKGGELDVWQLEDGSISMSCTLPTYTANCYFHFDGDEFDFDDCWDTYVPPPGPGGQTGTYFPGPTPVNGPGGAAVIGGGSGVKAPPENASAPTATPTPRRPGGSILGGIVATIGPAKLPPEPTRPPSGNRSGIAIILRECPPALPKLPQQFADCSVNQSVNNQVTFLVGGPGVQEVTVHGGGLNLSGLPAGKYLIRMTIPPGYGDPVGFCSFAPSEDQAPAPSQKIPIGNGSYTFELGQDQTMYCNWYISFDLSKAPVKAAAATPVAAASPESPQTSP